MSSSCDVIADGNYCCPAQAVADRGHVLILTQDKIYGQHVGGRVDRTGDSIERDQFHSNFLIPGPGPGLDSDKTKTRTRKLIMKNGGRLWSVALACV